VSDRCVCPCVSNLFVRKGHQNQHVCCAEKENMCGNVTTTARESLYWPNSAPAFPRQFGKLGIYSCIKICAISVWWLFKIIEFTTFRQFHKRITKCDCDLCHVFLGLSVRPRGITRLSWPILLKNIHITETYRHIEVWLRWDTSSVSSCSLSNPGSQ